MQHSTQLHPASLREVGGEKWGYIDNNGEFAIWPAYRYALPFQENGLAIVEVENKSGVINESGQFVVKPIYDNINPFSEGLSAVHDNSGYKIINEQGRVLTDKAYEFIGVFHEGRALFLNKKMKYGYLDRQGREVISAQYEEAGDFKSGKAVVKLRAGLYALIDRDGRMLYQYSHLFVGILGDGLMAFQDKMQGKYGYINEQGYIVLPLLYRGAEPFERGKAVVNMAEDYRNELGLIDKNGAFIIEPIYSEITRLGEDRLAVGIAIEKEKPYLGSIFAVYDLAGRKLSAFIYDDVLPYVNGLASASSGNETFFINSSGQKAHGWPTISGSGTLSVEGELIRADIDKKVFYLSHEGRIVWKQNSIIPLNAQYRVHEEKYKPNKNYLVYYPRVSGILDSSIQAAVNSQLQKLSALKEVKQQEQLEYSYFGDFSVPFFQKRLLVLKLDSYLFHFGAAHGMPSQIYPHVDLVSGQFFELADLFKKGSPYVKVLSGLIAEQIRTKEEYSYVWPDQYKGITENQPFYVTNNALHLYFLPYEIAPYAAGFPTFTIPYYEIADLIDTQGAFWQSYHR